LEIYILLILQGSLEPSDEEPDEKAEQESHVETVDT
jgi:hypothetical protein